jgi:predicted MFS family arabinose efflux permease
VPEPAVRVEQGGGVEPRPRAQLGHGVLCGGGLEAAGAAAVDELQRDQRPATQIVWLTYAPVTTTAAERFGVSENAVGWLANLFPLFYVLLAIPAGVLLDRWFRGAVVAGAVLTAVGALLRVAGDSYAWALAGQCLAAIAQPLVLNAITGVAGRYLREEDRPTGIAVGTASTFAGMVVAFVLGAALPDAGSLTTLVAIGAAVSVVGAIAVSVALRRPGEQRHTPPPRGTAGLRSAVRDPFVRKVCLLVFFPFGTFIALTTFGQALLEPAGVSAATASVILLVAVVSGVAGCAVVPVVAARRRAELPVMTVGLVLSAVACLLLAVVPAVATGFVSMTVVGFLLLPALPIVLELVGRRTGEAEGTAAGLVWLSGNLGGLVVGLVVGFLVGQPGLAFATCGVLCLLAVPGVWRLRPHLRELDGDLARTGESTSVTDR